MCKSIRTNTKQAIRCLLIPTPIIYGILYIVVDGGIVMIELDRLNRNVEEERNKAKRTRNLLIVLNVFVILFFFTSIFANMFSLIGAFGRPSFNIFGFFGPVILFIITLFASIFYYKKVRDSYTNKVKDIVFNEVFVNQFDNVTFDPRDGISLDILREYRLVDTADTQSTNDYLTGSYDGIPFTRSDVHTQSRSTDSEGHTTYITVFRGQVYSFDFNKNNSSKIRVVEKGFLNSFKIFNKDAITLENSEFNDLFVVNSDNHHDVFYIFTPHFIEKYMALHRKLDGRSCLVISNGTLYLAINNGRDSFEPRLKVLGDEFQRGLEQDINIIKTIIQDLDLTNTLFSDKS